MNDSLLPQTRRFLGLRICWKGMLLPLLLISCWGQKEANAENALPDHSIVPGFDRFYAAEEADAVRGGLLLLGELNCTSCHQAAEGAAVQISNKQAPLLGDVGSRANPEWIAKFLSDPQAVKAGTTMPHMLAALPAEERAKTVERLTHFLASQASKPFVISGPDGSAVAEGEKLFHTAGCVACHAPRKNLTDELSRTSVPLGVLEEKYSIQSLTAFLNDPLSVRPSGRMPHLPLAENQASFIAQFLLRETKAPAALNMAYYEGNVGGLPDFEKLKPVSTGGASGFDIGKPKQTNNIAFNFTGFLNIEKEGDYTFFTKSDDGSWLLLDDKLVVDNGGTHPAQEKSGQIKLTAGRHPIRVAYMQGGGEYELKVEYQGPDISRRQIPSAQLTSTAEPPPEQKKFVIDTTLAAEGRTLFGKLGCASCHQQGAGKEEIPSALMSPELAKLKNSGGCLGEQAQAGRPSYQLSAAQKKSLSAAITAVQAGKLPSWETADRVHATFTSLNCYACHQRGEVGGVVEARNPFFTANDKDLGDEGRLPPLLTGVGDKLKSQWLSEVLTKGAVARPYMDAFMPQFGEKNVAHLTPALEQLDLVKEAAPAIQEPLEVVKAAGHRLAGKNGLSCISCHMFYRHKSSGIQATDLSLMPQRLRKDWFYRYMLNPQQFRPGTRMPSAWPQGKAMRKEILAGNTDQQILALYDYLSDGKRAILPDGVVVTSMELIVGGEALVYRNFIAGAGSRAIGVGYAEEVNLAFDANEQRLALLWQGRFMDASRHWSGRGQGYEPPLGDKVLTLVSGAPFAKLESIAAPWPKETGHAAGYQFRGYELDKLRRPTFLYSFGKVDITDLPLPKEEGAKKTLVRTITLGTQDPVETLWHRIAAGGQIEPVDGNTFRINGIWTVKITSTGDAKPLLRDSSGPELIVPVPLKDGKGTLTIEYSW